MPNALRFRRDDTFTIAQFTDLHWHDGRDEDRRTLALMELVLDTDRPDFVVFTGDALAGEGCVDPATAWRRVAEPAYRREIPWASVFGNHDDEGPLDRATLMTVQRGLPGCLSEAGPGDVPGVGNYALSVRDAAEREVVSTLYFVDSGSYAPEAIGGYAWIHPAQVAWYRAAAQQARATIGSAGGGPASALLFLHIPLPEYEDVWRAGLARGARYESVCCPKINSGLFAALLDAGDVRGVFAGHDHVNDYEGALHGIRLCYGRATGYATYGRSGFERGARLIRLRRGESGFGTWCRLADGSHYVATEAISEETPGNA